MLSPLIFNVALVYAVRTVKYIQEGLKLNGNHHLVTFADDVNTLGGNTGNIQKKTHISIGF
jgi:hypothetical protein